MQTHDLPHLQSRALTVMLQGLADFCRSSSPFATRSEATDDFYLPPPPPPTFFCVACGVCIVPCWSWWPLLCICTCLINIIMCAGWTRELALQLWEERCLSSCLVSLSKTSISSDMPTKQFSLCNYLSVRYFRYLSVLKTKMLGLFQQLWKYALSDFQINFSVAFRDITITVTATLISRLWLQLYSSRLLL